MPKNRHCFSTGSMIKLRVILCQTIISMLICYNLKSREEKLKRSQTGKQCVSTFCRNLQAPLSLHLWCPKFTRGPHLRPLVKWRKLPRPLELFRSKWAALLLIRFTMSTLIRAGSFCLPSEIYTCWAKHLNTGETSFNSWTFSNFSVGKSL